MLKTLKKAWSSLLSGTEPATGPKSGCIYAVNGGKYLGEFFVYIEENNTDYCFLSLPKMESRNVPKDKFDTGINDKIIEPVETLPKNIYKIC